MKIAQSAFCTSGGGYSLFKLANIANDACASPTII